MSLPETIKGLEGLKTRLADSALADLLASEIATLECALAALRETESLRASAATAEATGNGGLGSSETYPPEQSAREKAAREAAAVCRKQPFIAGLSKMDRRTRMAETCEAAILRHFNLEAK